MSKIVRFDNEPLFKEFVSKYGMNLFLGAGFSTYAYNEQDEALPLLASFIHRLKHISSIRSTTPNTTPFA